MPRRRTRRSPRGSVPRGVSLLAVFLLVLSVAGIAGVKLSRTTRGKAILVDLGLHTYYAALQDDLDRELRRVLSEAGLARPIHERIVSRGVGPRRSPVRHWDATCARSCSFAQINLELTRAVEKKGGVVRSATEARASGEERPRALVFEAGSRKHATHRITIRRALPAEPPRDDGRPPPPRLALVIDDFGYSMAEIVQSFLALELPVTISVIPSLPRSRDVAVRAREAGKEVLLHLPMEAEEQPADEGMVLTSMNEGEIASLVERYIRETPGVVGVNNHQGSKATQDARVMEAVLSVARSFGLFFLDSLTSSKSVAYTTARRLGLPAVRNDLFIDADTEDPVVIGQRIDQLVSLARANGTAVGIGHPKPWTYEAIRASEALFRESSVELVFLSTLVE